MTRVGLFELVDPPAGQEQMVRSVLDACAYPWARIIPAIRNDPDQAVVVRWLDMGQGGTGRYENGTYEIHLSTTWADWQRDVPFVFAHELGHLVDFATFYPADRDALLPVMHSAKPQIGHYNHDHPDAGHTSERWLNGGEPYTSRIYEAYADAWVATFTPTLFANVRFVHWPTNLADIRRLTLAKEIIVFDDVPADHPHRDGIEWAAGQGLVTGYPDGSFKPEAPVTRGQLSTILHRQAAA